MKGNRHTSSVGVCSLIICALLLRRISCEVSDRLPEGAPSPVPTEGVRPCIVFPCWRARGGNPIIGVGGRGVRGAGPGVEIDPTGVAGNAANRGMVGVGAGDGLEPEGTEYPVISFGVLYPLVPRIGFGPGGRGVAGDGV